MHTLEPILERHPFFTGLEEHYLELLVGCASNVRFNAGEYILREGGEASRFYLIRTGLVRLEVFAREREPIAIQTLGEGDVLGWSWLVQPYRWSLDARALELTRAIALDGECLRNKSEEDPKLGYELHKRFASIITEQLRATQMQLLDVYGKRP
jgi:CRP/FNR family transcriptional regulator, cyclic AMP receptor protein